MSVDDEIAAFAAKVHAVGGQPERITIRSTHVHLVPEVGITFANPDDARNFTIGMAVDASVPGGVLRGWRARVYRATSWLRWRWRRSTRWWRPRGVVVATDPHAGEITLATERRSWRRWRWERA